MANYTIRLVAAALTASLITGCGVRQTERIVRVVDSTENQPVSKEQFSFASDFPFLSELFPRKRPATVWATLDTNGEARVHFPNSKGWGSLHQNRTNHFGVSLTRENILRGGRFRLFAPPPAPGDTNIYPSNYILEIIKR